MTTRRIRLALASVLAVWAVAAIWLVPAVIRWVYRGGGPAALRRMMSGRAEVPVEAYLVRWSHSALPVSFMLVTMAIAGWFILPLVVRGRELRADPPDVTSPAPTLALAAVLGVSGWCGLVLGLGESHYLAWKTLVLHEIIPEFRYVSAESLWMAPAVDVVTLTVVGALGWGIGRIVRRPLTLRWLVVLTGFAGLSSLILVTGRLAVPAALLLAAGLATRLGSTAARHRARFLRNVRRTAPLMAAAVLAVGLLVTVVPRVTERLAMARLPAVPAGEAPNVLVIVLDTERASSMDLYGYHRATTPNLTRIARRGVLFDRAIAPSSWTLPSHASMFTSRYPGDLGVSFMDPLDDTYPTLAEVLRDHGYMTAGFVGNIVFCTPLFGLNRGFLHFEAQPVSLQMTLESAWLTRTAHQLLEPGVEKSAVRKDASRVTNDFLAWQATQPNERPYLAFLNYFDAHAPYVSPPPYRTLFAAGATPPPVLRGEKANVYQPGEIQGFVDEYDGAIAHIDAQLGVLFAELERRGQLHRTVVVVTADHGEEFGEHGKLGHGFAVTLPLLHVPLLVLHPSLPAGVRVSQAVTLTDLPATVMDLVGKHDHPFRGRPWSRFWSPAFRPDTAPEPVFSEYRSQQSVLLGGWHYVVGGRESLYDVVADPSEQVDRMATADPELLAQVRSALERFRTSGAATRR